MEHDPNLSQQLTRQSMALVLAGGRGSRLKQLTDRRAKPAVYFGGKYRIIDFALSNCLNSGIRRIGVVTQYKSHSLLRHLQHGWNFLRAEINEFVDLLPAQQRVDESSWYRGTADAVYQNLDILRGHRAKYIVVLAGDHIYKMDYSRLLADHAESGAECTVGCIEAPLADATGFGVMAVDGDYRITDFVEKPAEPPSMPGKPDRALASMGIYVFNAEFLYEELARDIADPASEHDFGKNVIPRAVADGEAHAHPFSRSCVGQGAEQESYWRDVGTIDAYWAANLDLTEITPALNLYDRSWPIWTYQQQLPSAKFVLNESITHSTFAGGCIVTGSTLRSSVLFSEVVVDTDSKLNEAVLLPGVHIGKGARLKRVVVDRGCRIPPGLIVGEDEAEDSARFERTAAGVTLITRPMLAALCEAEGRFSVP
ncbi:glucose-1-phosphate adenylyltransferase [Salinisphaera sp.]|uniref:glucose-1-phosphate adenylyltransferase n=1 Tax=Salinisphaera sp. TaxID=1914330 RepID=UPI002D79E3BE|nr:glucose-1-phosphate adenylyltransferase [Salinisphaera sp.]